MVGLDQRSLFAAGIVFAIGMLTLGLPGAMFVEVLIPAGRKLPPDSAWPLAILITLVGALIIVPVSLALRFVMPHAVGWHHDGSVSCQGGPAGTSRISTRYEDAIRRTCHPGTHAPIHLTFRKQGVH